MRLFQKILLAFGVVILVAVGVVAVLVAGRTTEEFHRYALLYGGRTQVLAEILIAYYAQRGSWDGLQAALPSLATTGQGRGRGGPPVGAGGVTWDFHVADAEGRVVAHLEGEAGGTLAAREVEQALPLEFQGRTVGYLLPDRQGTAREAFLGEPEQQFLSAVRRALLIGAGVAFVAAIVVAGFLVRGIVAPIKRLSRAAEQIAEGDLEVRAVLQGDDEIAHLGRTFNRMAESLERAQQARRAQTADIAHELRNPLSVLQGTLEAVVDGVYAPTPENLEPALDQVRTLNRLVEDLRLLALADAGRLQLERHTLEVTPFLRRLAEAYRPRLEGAGLVFELEMPGPLPPLRADADRLRQVIGNVLENAVKYVPTGGRVRLLARPEAQGVEIRIIDNGPGVSEAALSQLFDRFWRGEPSRSRATGGSGLGLSVARHIVEAHGGRLWAEKTPGGGLTVALWLPAAT
ncbi:MAG: ATP-binding protein [Anaerolineae bacterium]